MGRRPSWVGVLYSQPAPKRTKADAQRIHAERRCFERYGAHLTDVMHEALVRQIQRGDAKLLEKQSLRLSLYRVSWEGEPMRVVYDRNRKTLVTFLPLEAQANEERDIDDAG
jgi:hypothetical protein